MSEERLEIQPARLYSFDEFELDLGSFTLRQGGREVGLEPQVLSLLAYFVTHNDTLISKDELLDELWGHRFVSESAVATQIKALRKALGDDGRSQRIVKTVHGRGYRFVAPVTVAGEIQAPEPEPAKTPARTSNLGYERTKLIGRDDELARCIAAFETYRLVSLLGIGGTGKTRLAKAVGRAVQDRYPDGVWFVDLVPVRDGAGIDTAIASVMGIDVGEGELREQIAAAVCNSQVLFILDNCEHIEDDVAGALDFFLEHTVSPQFLATSRDPIDLADELRFFIDPLPVTSDAGVAPAVELFMLTAQRHGFVDGDLDPDLVFHICDHLDGLPLAIELAAAQLKQLTLGELMQRLDRRFELLAGRQREGAHRQDSLIGVVENTWQLLEEGEQKLLGQLAVFPGQFTIADVEEVFLSELPNGISFAMSRLVELCLLSRTSRQGGWWRLLETVRLFALDKLGAVDAERNAERHAEWVLKRLGTYPDDNLHSFPQARWNTDHYADITAAELYFERVGRTGDALHVCCSVALMIQLDDGARAQAKLKRIERYLQTTTEALPLSQLHGTAALCAQVMRDPKALAEHADVNLTLCREVGDPKRLAGALILASLTNNFSDPQLAFEQLNEAVAIARDHDHPLTLKMVLSYQVWTLTMVGEYAAAVDLAEEVVQGKLEPGVELDNPTYNAVCALIACHLFDQPQRALQWTRQLLEYADAHSLWGASILYACAFATAGESATAVHLCCEVERRLRRAGRSPWPDLLVAAIVLAEAEGEHELAQRWLATVVTARKPQQSFHTIAVYRQLRERMPVALHDEQAAKSRAYELDQTGQEALEWLRHLC